MSAAPAILTRAWALGVRLEPRGPRLHVVAPDDLDEGSWLAIRADLAEHKVEILELLAVRLGGPSWEELSVLRWGPAIGDPEPGLDVKPPGARPAPTREEPPAEACAAWIDDPTLAVDTADVRRSLEEVAAFEARRSGR
jgi:hypothetical protein